MAPKEPPEDDSGLCDTIEDDGRGELELSNCDPSDVARALDSLPGDLVSLELFRPDVVPCPVKSSAAGDFSEAQLQEFERLYGAPIRRVKK